MNPSSSSSGVKGVLHCTESHVTVALQPAVQLSRLSDFESQAPRASWHPNAAAMQLGGHSVLKTNQTNTRQNTVVAG